MYPLRYTQVSTEAGERYLVILQAFRGLLQNALARPFSSRTAADLRVEAERVATTFARTERTIIETELRDTAQNAQERVLDDLNVSGRVETPEALETFLTQSVEHLDVEIASQLARDIATLVKRYREFGIEAQLHGNATPNRLSQYSVRFYFRDRAGRIIPSQRFVRVAWRQSLVALGAEFYLLEASQRAARSVVVTYPDPNHRNEGLEIALHPSQRGVSFLDVRDEVFHPMTEAVLKAS